MTLRILPEFAILFLLVFARVGTMMMLMPALGERVVSARIRVIIAVFVALLTLPIVRASIVLPQGDMTPVIRMLITEMLVGLTLGLAARFLMATLQTAGVLISYQMGLSFTMAFDPTGGDRGQSAAIGNFLSLLGIALIFAAELHHVAILGIVDSYRTITPGSVPPSGDALELAVSVAASAFRTAVQISAPFLVFGFVFNLGLGILSRMMPQLQVFFLALPASILIGTIIFIFVIGLMMDGFLQHVGRVFFEIFPGSR